MQKLKKLYDLDKLQNLLTQFYRVTGITAAIVDDDGAVLVSSPRPSLCERFFDKAVSDPHSSCHLNRMALLQPGQDQRAARLCPHGLLDAAEPIIVQEERLGALLIGQVFATPPEFAAHRTEVERCGFDPVSFRSALEMVPVVSPDYFEQARMLMVQLSSMLAEQGAARQEAELSARIEQQLAAHTLKEIRRQETQLKLYAMDQASCNELLESALADVLTCCESPFGYLYLFDEETTLLTLYSWFGLVPTDCIAFALRTVVELEKAGLLAEPIRQRKPVITNTPSTLSPFFTDTQQQHVQLARHMNLPIIRNGSIVAVVGVANREEHYNDADGRHLQLFMDGAWNMLERRKALDELSAAKEFAESASRLKSELLANVSHELRTPLNGIIGSTQLLRFTRLSDEQNEYLSMIEESSNTELTLVNNLLELVKMEADTITLERVPLSLEACVAEVVQVYEGAATKKGLQVHCVVAPDLPATILADKPRIKQILLILVGNAVKFTETGAITVHVGCQRSMEDGLAVKFTVADTGIGIASEQMQCLFQPFTQLDMSSTRKFGGLGLGLSICKRLTELMGGRIWACSKPDEGSKFSVEIPVALPAVGTSPESRLRACSILLAEDDQISALSAATLLRKMGHTVVVAENGAEAVAIWQRHPVDLVLMDINMPVMSGLEALHEIRRLEQLQAKPPTPVIAQTAYACYNRESVIPKADFDAVIAKPLLLEELEAVLSRQCRRHASA